jgi:hypothetical protein
VGFEVFTAMVMRNSVFRDITPCSPLSQPTFRMNILLPSSGLESKPSNKSA